MKTLQSLRRAAAGAALVLACAPLSAHAQAQASAPGGTGPRAGMGMMGQNLGIAYERAVADGTPEQKARMHALVQTAEADLQPLQKQLRDGHRQALQLLSQPKVDRAALETVRASEVQILDQISRRLVRAGADAAELMTPAQRARFFNERLRHRGNY